MNAITLKEYRKGSHSEEKWYIGTGFGSFLVSWVDDQYWVGTKEGNAGLGRSFCCHAGTIVYSSREEASKAHEKYTKNMKKSTSNFLRRRA